MVASNSSCSPPCVVARWIGGVKLEFSIFVVSCEEEGCAEGSCSSNLGVVLFNVANVDNNFFNGNAGSVFDSVALHGKQVT